jgi:tetratricopeptide (TPR) repeat protein
MELAQLYIKENKDATAIELLEMAMPVLGDSVSSQTIKGYVALCQLYAKAGNEAKLKSAVASLSAAISRTGTDNDRSWYRSIFDVCALLARSGQTPLCRQLYTAAYKSAGQSNEMHSNGWDWYLNEGTRILVQQLVELGQLDEAENVHIASIDAFRSPGGEIAGISSAYTDLAEFYLTHGMDAKLQPAVDQLVAAVHKFGKNNNNHKLDELARKLESSKHYQACIQVAQAFIDSTPNGPRQEVQIAREYVMIGNAYMGLDNQEKAKEALGKALDEASRNLPPELSPLVAPVRAAIEKSVGDKHSSPLSSVITQLAEVSSYRDSNWDGNVSYRSNIMLNLARQFASQQMYAEADVCYKQALEWNNKAYGPSSIQSSGVMSSYASYLRSQGKGQQAQELSDAVEAINQVYQRQIRGESGVYRPFAPLTETIRGLKLRNTQADSST